jgi:hypothetical protein
MVTKNDGGQNGDSNWTLFRHCGDRVLFTIWTYSFCVKNLFSFPLATAFKIGIVSTNRGSGVKMFLSVITALILLAQIIDLLIRRFNINRIIILQIRSATPIQDKKTSAPIYRRWKNWLRFAYSSWQCLFNKLSRRKQKYWVLERNGMFKFKMTPDHHNAIQNLNYYLRPDPPLFSLPSTFKLPKKMRGKICFLQLQCWSMDIWRYGT